MIGSVGAIGWSLSDIDDPNVVNDRAPGQQVQPAIPTDRNAPPYDDRIAARSLRGPLYDPPPQPAPPVERPKPPAPVTPIRSNLEWTLVGTIIEAGQSLAILADASGKFDVKGIGESLDLVPPGVTLQDIESEQVTLQYQGRKSTVQLDRSTKKSNGGGGKRANNRRRNP